MHLFSYGTSSESGACSAQSLVRDAWIMSTRCLGTRVYLYILYLRCVGRVPYSRNTHLNKPWFFNSLPWEALAARNLRTVGCLFCWQAPLGSTCSVDDHRWEALVWCWGNAEVCLCTVMNDKSSNWGTGDSEKHFLQTCNCRRSCQKNFFPSSSGNLYIWRLLVNSFCDCSQTQTKTTSSAQ